LSTGAAIAAHSSIHISIAILHVVRFNIFGLRYVFLILTSIAIQIKVFFKRKYYIYSFICCTISFMAKIIINPANIKMQNDNDSFCLQLI